MRRMVGLAALVVLFCMLAALDGNKIMERNDLTFYDTSGDVATSVTNSYLVSEIMERRLDTGYTGLQLNISGTGTADVAYLVSNDRVTFVTEDGASLLFDDVTASSGPGSDGDMACKVPAGPFLWLRIKISEVGGSNAITPTAKMSIQ